MGWYEELQERARQRRAAIVAGAFGGVCLVINSVENGRQASSGGKWVTPPYWWSSVFGTGNIVCFGMAFLFFASGGWHAPWSTKRMPIMLLLLSLLALLLAILPADLSDLAPG